MATYPVFLCIGEDPPRRRDIKASTFNTFLSEVKQTLSPAGDVQLTVYDEDLRDYVLLESLEGLREQRPNKIRIQPVTKCDRHAAQPYTLWCREDGCMVCPSCVASQRHAGHTFEDVDDVVEEERAKVLQQAFPWVQVEFDGVSKRIQDLETELENTRGRRQVLADLLTKVERIQEQTPGHPMTRLLHIGQVRRELRPLLPLYHFVHTHDFDRNGLFHFLGTRKGTTSWHNPVDAGMCDVDASHAMCSGEPKLAVGHTNPAIVQLKEFPGTSLTFDLRRSGLVFQATHYTIRNRKDHDGHFLRWWVLEASTDTESWKVVDNRTDDARLRGVSGTHTFPVATTAEAAGPGDRYSLFRLRQTGPNSSGQLYLSIGGFELYGMAWEAER